MPPKVLPQTAPLSTLSRMTFLYDDGSYRCDSEGTKYHHPQETCEVAPSQLTPRRNTTQAWSLHKEAFHTSYRVLYPSIMLSATRCRNSVLSFVLSKRSKVGIRVAPATRKVHNSEWGTSAVTTPPQGHWGPSSAMCGCARTPVKQGEGGGGKLSHHSET